MGHGATVLAIGESSRLWPGIESLLLTVEQVRSLAMAADGSSALRLATDLGPALIILDFDSGSPALMQALRTAVLDTRILALIGDADQREAARAAGADCTVLQGSTPEELLRCMEDLLR